MSSSNYCKLTTTKQTKKEGTQTVWIDTEVSESFISETEYNNLVDARTFFKNLGATEYVKYDHTQKGKKIVRLISTSPKKQFRSIYLFDFSS